MRIFIFTVIVALTLFVGILYGRTVTTTVESAKSWNESEEYLLAKKLDNKYFVNCKQFLNFWLNVFPNAEWRYIKYIKSFGHYEVILKDFGDKLLIVDCNYHLDGIVHLRLIKK